MDLSQLSDADLDALEKNDLTKVSDAGLDVLHAQSAPQAPQNKSANTGIANTIASQVASGVTAGFDDELGGGLSAAGRIFGVDGLGGKIKDVHMNPDGPTLDPDKIKQSYRATRDQLRGMKDDQQEARPIISGVANVGGMLANPIAGGEAGLVKLGALGAAQGLGDSRADLLNGDIGGAAADTGIGAGLGVAAGVAAPYIGKGINAVGSKLGTMAPEVSSYLAKKFGRVAANIPEDYTEQYLARDGKISARPSSEIMDELSGHYNDAGSSLENYKAAAQQAKDAANETRQGLTNELQDKRFKLGNDLSDSNESLNKATQAQKEQLASVKSPIEMADDVQSSIQDLKAQVKQGSQESYKILENDPKGYSVRQAGPILRKMADDMNIQSFNGAHGTPGASSVPSLLHRPSTLYPA